MLILESATLSDIGCIRTVNQDRMFAKSDYINGSLCGLFGVADGMGGLSEGAFAASMAVNILEQWWYSKLHLLVGYTSLNEDDIIHELKKLFYAINYDIKEYADNLNAMVGTTFSVLLICNNKYYVVHAGDSRIYMITRFGIRRRISKLTDDHTWLAKQVREGAISTDEVADHPEKNRLTSCLGVLEIPEIFIDSDLIKMESLFILCSDGLYDVISDQELLKKSPRRVTCSKLVKRLIDIAIKRDATDNITVIAVKCKNY